MCDKVTGWKGREIQRDIERETGQTREGKTKRDREHSE